MAEAIVNPGYMWASILIMGLLAALKGRSRLWPGHLEKALAIAFAIGLFGVAMIVFADAFPPIGEIVSDVSDGLSGYIGL